MARTKKAGVSSLANCTQATSASARNDDKTSKRRPRWHGIQSIACTPLHGYQTLAGYSRLTRNREQRDDQIDISYAKIKVIRHWQKPELTFTTRAEVYRISSPEGVGHQGHQGPPSADISLSSYLLFTFSSDCCTHPAPLRNILASRYTCETAESPRQIHDGALWALMGGSKPPTPN
ncbi:hypothetical protein B0T13DRAFT_268841 [Neurospora crassa]|nr:hypothetical protein B0T13DRAFT_268841 [Neurospora crassa]